MTHLTLHRPPFTLSTDPARIDVAAVHAFLSERSYWAQGRTLEAVQTSIAHALCFGIYTETGAQAAFCRVVTDYATFGWLCDVLVLEAFRGHGLGKWLIESVVAHPALSALPRLVLATRDAHTLYQVYGGFAPLPNPERWMIRLQRPSPT